MSEMLFSELAELGERLEQTSKRRELASLLADFLLKLSTKEIPPAVRLTVGQVFPEWDPRALNLSAKAVKQAIDKLIDASPAIREQVSVQAVDPGEATRMLLEKSRIDEPLRPALRVTEVFQILTEIAETSGRGSRARKSELLGKLFVRATPIEAKYLVKIIYQEMRHGVNEGVMIEGIAKATGLKAKLVRRANQLLGELGEVALIALTQGESGLAQVTLKVFRPIKPMLAQTAEAPEEAFERYPDGMALEYKLDGARVQIHRRGDEVRIFSRNLADVTASLPDVVQAIKEKLSATEAIVEGEAIAVDAQGRPLPFQHLMRRFRRKHDVEEMVNEIPVQLFLFDALYLDGESLLGLSNQVRWEALQTTTAGQNLVCRLLPKTVQEAKDFAEQSYRDGHEGVMAKELASEYSPGVRGKSWLKLKHVVSLDLVVVAADWGYGRRHGWLSNYHLAARDQESGDYPVVGKTFKGLKDSEFKEMTTRLLDLELSREGSTVFVRPQVVVEVRFNEIQESTQYRSGLALRFARIANIRADKSVAEADTMETLQALYAQQFECKGQLA